MSAGKGDKPRPVNKKVFDENYDFIFRKNSLKIEFCKWCAGFGERRCIQTDNNNGYEKCNHCKGTGYEN